MRLIDADKLKNELTSICPDKVNDYSKAVKAFIEFVDNAPTVTIKEWTEEMPIYIKDAMLEALRPQVKLNELNEIKCCDKCKYSYPQDLIKGIVYCTYWNHNFNYMDTCGNYKSKET